MAQRRAPQNKNAGAAPENKDRDSQLRRLLKAENNQWSGVISRQELRAIADRIRLELQGEEN